MHRHDGVQLYQPKVYRLEGTTFTLVKLPELTLPSAEWPEKKGRKGAHGREFILPARWLDPNTLVLKRECQCTIFGKSGDEKDEKEWSLLHEITIAFDARGSQLQFRRSKKSNSQNPYHETPPCHSSHVAPRH